MQCEDIMNQRTMVYIDGFNLYHGLKDAKLQRYFWLNIHQFSLNLLHNNQQLEKVHYFTARILRDRNNPDKFVRQHTYLEALKTLQDVEIHEGEYSRKKMTCPKCGLKWKKFEEKRTDVNIAVRVLADLHENLFDTAIIVFWRLRFVRALRVYPR